MTNILGLITARGGSKRLPGKNIKYFHGQPLIVWSIKAGLESGVFDKFVLTTDDKDIAEVGIQNGLEVPFLRPPELAQDASSSFDAIKHAVVWLKENQNYEADWIILLEPSSPGRQPFHIQEVAQIITKENVDSVVGISEIPAHYSPQKALIFSQDHLLTTASGALVRDLNHRNQDLAKSYYINSSIYAFKVKNLFDESNPSLWGEKTYGYLMDSKYALDIDTPEDWDMAEFKIKKILDNL